MSRERKFVVKEDIVIPAGTVMTQAPSKMSMSSDYKKAVIGLTNDTCGSFIYPVTGDDEEMLKKHFLEIKEVRSEMFENSSISAKKTPQISCIESKIEEGVYKAGASKEWEFFVYKKVDYLPEYSIVILKAPLEFHAKPPVQSFKVGGRDFSCDLMYNSYHIKPKYLHEYEEFLSCIYDFVVSTDDIEAINVDWRGDFKDKFGNTVRDMFGDSN